MVHDRQPDAVLGADRFALDALARVGSRLLIGALADRHALQADMQPRHVHHDEHGLEATVLLAYQRADGAAVVAIGHDAGRAGVDAELVLEADAAQIVARAQAAVVVNEKLRHDEQRNAFGARGRVGQAREHEMDDVAGHVVFAPRDEDLLAGDAVMIAFAHRPRPQRTEVGAGLRLRQVHRAGPFAGYKPAEIEALLRRRAKQFEQFAGADAEHRTERPGEIGAHPHFIDRGVERDRQSLAAVLRRRRQRVPATAGIGTIGFLEAGWRAYHAVFEPALLDIAGPVGRR